MADMQYGPPPTNYVTDTEIERMRSNNERFMASAADHASIYDKFSGTQGRLVSAGGRGGVPAGKHSYGAVPASYCVTLTKSGVPVCEKTEHNQCCEHIVHMTGIESL